MTPECVNKGGVRSLIHLPAVPRLESPQPLPAAAESAVNAWRAREGAILTVLDPEGCYYRARLARKNGELCAIAFRRLPRPAESGVALEVYHALPEKERFELVLQKLTELGAVRIVPMTSSRSSTLAERDAGQKKSHRWPEVILRAARQCRRAMLPELGAVTPWGDAVRAAGRADLKLMLAEGEEGWGIGEALAGQRADRVALLVGPEGGFTNEEVEEARGLGILPVGFGPRILRTETAAIAAAAILQYALGDLR